MTVLGQANQLKKHGVAANALWPQTTIATVAIKNLLGGDAMMKQSRHPAIMADAAWAIVQRPSKECTGNFFIDEEVLREEGTTDFTHYAVDPTRNLMKDLFVE